MLFLLLLVLLSQNGFGNSEVGSSNIARSAPPSSLGPNDLKLHLRCVINLLTPGGKKDGEKGEEYFVCVDKNKSIVWLD